MEKIVNTVITVIILSFIGMTIYVFSDHETRIKTEFGDVFIVQSDSLCDDAYISCLAHNFDLAYSGFESDLSPVCDSEFFRCYKFAYGNGWFYICGLKPDGDYFWIDPYAENTPPFFEEKYSADFLKVFLADKYIMQVTMNYMDGVYHDEIMDMAQKLTSGNYEGLDKYGLTEEMINDKESLDEKIGIMEEYLKENRENHSESGDRRPDGQKGNGK